MAVKIILKNSSVEDKRPSVSQLENGEIALNYNEAGAFLTCKDTNGDIQQVGGVKINEVAPDSPPIQCLWFQPSSFTLFVYDGDSWLPVAGGGGGGGTPPVGGAVITVIGNDGIDADTATLPDGTKTVTLDVELDGNDCGLKFNSSKLSAEIASDSKLGSIKIGDHLTAAANGTTSVDIASELQRGVVRIGAGIDVDAAGTISVDIGDSLVYKGSVDLNNPPSGQINPNPAEKADTYVVSLNANPINAGWTGIGGDVAVAGDLVVYNGTQWELIRTGGSVDAFDDRYVKLVGDDTAQTITGTGGLKTEGLLESEGGVSVTGGLLQVTGFIPGDNYTFEVRGNLGGSIIKNLDPQGNSESEIKMLGSRLTYLTRVDANKEDNVRIDAKYLPSLLPGGSVFINSICSPADDIESDANAFFVQINVDSQNQAGTAAQYRNIYGIHVKTNLENFVNVSNRTVGVGVDTAFASDQLPALNNYAFYGVYNEHPSSPVKKNFNFYATGSAPNFFLGDTYIGGNTTLNTFELWKSTLTEEQLEQLEAGTLVAPANVSLPGDGSFARAWYYNQQSAEDQALLDSGELEYPEHFAAATFTDTFALGDNTNINLNSDGSAKFRGDVEVGINNAAGVVLTSPSGNKFRLTVDDAGNLSTVAVV